MACNFSLKENIIMGIWEFNFFSDVKYLNIRFNELGVAVISVDAILFVHPFNNASIISIFLPF